MLARPNPAAYRLLRSAGWSPGGAMAHAHSEHMPQLVAGARATIWEQEVDDVREGFDSIAYAVELATWCTSVRAERAAKAEQDAAAEQAKASMVPFHVCSQYCLRIDGTQCRKGVASTRAYGKLLPPFR